MGSFLCLGPVLGSFLQRYVGDLKRDPTLDSYPNARNNMPL